MGFFESFSAPFMMSVALWPLVSFIVTVPVLAMLYHRDNRLGFGAALSAYATVLYLIGLLCFTLYPMPDDPAAYCATTICIRSSIRCSSSVISAPTG